MFPLYLRVLCAVLAILSIYASNHLSSLGFQDIQRFKQIERVIEQPIISIVEGQVLVKGFVEPLDARALLRASSSGVPSIYFRYRMEEEETDSDGNTSWRTREEYARSIDFIVEDHSGKAKVSALADQSFVDWELPQSYQKVVGRYRYTEWRLEPGQKTSVLAWSESHSDSAENVTLEFKADEPFRGIVTTYTMDEVRGTMGGYASLKIWGGVCLLALAVFLVLLAFKVHRVITFLSFITVSSFLLLSSQGLIMLKDDVMSGLEYVENRLQLMQKALDSEVQGAVPERSSAIKVDMHVLVQSYREQNSHFPENVTLALLGAQYPLVDVELNENERLELGSRMAQVRQTQLSQNIGWFGVLGLVLFILLAWLGVHLVKVKRLIENVVTSSTKGASYGIAEIKGKVAGIGRANSSDNNETALALLKSPLTSTKVVWYRYKVEEKRGSGKKERWVTIEDRQENCAFACEDADGRLLIDPEDAEIITRHKKTERRGRTRVTEWLLKPGDELYAIGYARMSDESAQLELAKEDGQVFILSNYPENDIMLRKAMGSMFAFLFAFSFLFGAAVVWRGLSGQFSATDYMFSGLVAPLGLLALLLVIHFNDLVFLNNRADRNWGNIQVSLKKRFDLLPRLENVLKKYLSHEADLLRVLTQSRSRVEEITSHGDSANGMGHQISQLIALESQAVDGFKLTVEDYPDLKGDALAREFMSKVTMLEDELALMRNGYNDAVTQYNERVQSFPDVILAKLCGFKQKERLS